MNRRALLFGLGWGLVSVESLAQTGEPAPITSAAPDQTPPAAASATPQPASGHMMWRDPNPPAPRRLIRLDGVVEPVEEGHHPHHGIFARLSAGLGVGTVWGGDLGPKPGFKPVGDLSHTGPALSIAAQLGGGAEDYALAGELYYERLLTRLNEPSDVSFQMFGIGAALSWYSDEDWFATAHLRWLWMLLWKPEIACWYERGDGTSGPGIGLTLGKEWHNERGRGFGLGLQGNYVAFSGNPELDYLSGLVLVTLTAF